MKTGRKLLLLVAAIIALMVCFAFGVSADTEYTEGYYTYTVENDEAVITEYNGSEVDIIIPDTLGGYRVTSIEDEAFSDCDRLIGVKIPDGVTAFGYDAFSGCVNLKSIVLPDVKVMIDVVGLGTCISLADVYFAGSEAEWKKHNPRYDNSLFDIHYYFRGCENHEETEKTAEVSPSFTKHGFTEGERCTECGYYVSGHEIIHCNEVIDSICDICSKEIITITEETYEGLKYGIVNEKATILGFVEENLDANLVIPSVINGYPVVSIGNDAFYNCGIIESVVIPEGVTGIAENSFFACNNMKSVQLPDGLKYIGDCAFFFCSFETFDIPDTVIKLGTGALSGNAKLEELVIPGSVRVLEPLFSYSSGSSGVESIILEPGVEEVLGYCFSNLNKLEHLVIPDTVKSIGSNIIDVEFVNTLMTDICYNGSEEQWEEISHNLDEEVPDVKIHFNYCLNHINIVNKQGVEATDKEHGYTSGVFCNDCNYWVSGHRKTHYNGTSIDYWCDICSFYISGVEEVETDLFRACIYDDKAGISYVKVSDGDVIIPSVLEGAIVTSLKSYCCSDKEITSVVIPETVVYIGDYAFSYCSSLTDVYYSGTEEQWHAMNIESGNQALLDAEIHFNWCSVHVNITEVSEQKATCAEEGYTAGVYCNDCKNWISGHEVIKAGHNDENADRICDVCGENVYNVSVGKETNVTYDGEETYYYFIPTVTGKYTIKSLDDTLDPYCTLYDENMNELTYDDDSVGDCNFAIIYHLEKGKTYYFSFKAYEYGEYPVIITYNDVTDEPSTEPTTQPTTKPTTTAPTTTAPTTTKPTTTAPATTTKPTTTAPATQPSIEEKEPENIKAKSVKTNSVKLTWDKVDGADSYIVYYSTNGKKWTKKTTKTNTITVKKLKAGTKYKFKVVAVADGKESEESQVFTTSTKPAKVTLKSVKSTKAKTAVVTWATVKGANGYQVTYSTSKKFTKKTTKNVTVKKAKTKKTTLKKLKSGKKYFVKVRAYKTVNGKKIYGAYSKVMTVKVK